MPSQSRRRRSATTAVVPVPMNGSRTTPGRLGAKQSQRRSSPTSRVCRIPSLVRRLLIRVGRVQAASHCTQIRSGHVARIGRSTSASGKVAWWPRRSAGGGDRPHVAGVLAACVPDAAGCLEPAQAGVVPLIAAVQLALLRPCPISRAVRDADRVEVEEVVAALGGEDHNFIGRAEPVGRALRERVRLVPDGDVADDPAVSGEGQRQPLRRKQEAPARRALARVPGVAVAEIEPQRAGRFQRPAGLRRSTVRRFSTYSVTVGSRPSCPRAP